MRVWCACFVIVLLTACTPSGDRETTPAARADEPSGQPAVETTSAESSTLENQSALEGVDWIANARTSAREQGIPEADLILFSDRKQANPGHVHGIDVSHHQDEIDWDRVKAAGIDFVYCKASEGVDLPDPRFADNWAALRQRDIPHGAYHMFRPEDEVKPQVDLFLATLRQGGGSDGMLPPVLDIERNSGVKKVSKQVLHARAVEWVRLVEKETGVKPLIYTNPTFWRDYLSGDHELVQFPLWVSEYDLGASEPAHTAAWKEWALWQFSRYGIVDGIGKPVDLNRLSGTLESLYAVAGSGAKPRGR